MDAGGPAQRRRPRRVVVRRRVRRGMTFLEVTLATAMLALVTASVFSAINFAIGSQARHEQLLGAAEVASRVVVMYLDDPDATLAQQDRPMDYGPLRYRWSARSETITMKADADAAAQSGVGGGPSLSRLEELTVQVWLSEESGGTRDPAPGVPQVSLKRMLDMNPTFRNPDSLEGAMESGSLLERILGAGGAGAAGEGEQRGGSRGGQGGSRRGGQRGGGTDGAGQGDR
jgi:type II secretory pathway pseudopilin PulG